MICKLRPDPGERVHQRSFFSSFDVSMQNEELTFTEEQTDHHKLSGNLEILRFSISSGDYNEARTAGQEQRHRRSHFQGKRLSRFVS